MKNLPYILLFICLPMFSWAQGGYKLVGVAQDAENKPVSFATVSLWEVGKTVAYKAVNADDNGAYSIEQIAQGNYTLKVEMVGYSTQELPLVFDAKTLPTTVQNITLQTSSKELKEVTLEAKKEFIETTPDAVIIRPDANPTTQGGTATDVLQQTPNVQVDASGNITMRGGRPNVMINGRMSGFGDGRRGGGGGMGGNPLDQINAEDIESISISTNPSARFDAEGGGGLIDVRLKRDRQLGTHGMVAFGGGIPRGRANANFRINHRTKKTNVFVGYGGRLNNRLGTGDMERQTLNGDKSLRQLLDQNQVTANSNLNHNVRFGGDYYISEKTTLGLEATYGLSTSRGDDFTRSNFTNNFTTNFVDSLTTQLNKNTNLSRTFEYNLIFQHKFKKEKRELSASFSQIFAKDDGENNLDIQHLKSDMSSLQNPTLRETVNLNNNTIITGQVDYVTPHGKKGFFETGFKFTNRDLVTDSDVDNFNVAQNAWVRDTRISNAFNFTENVQAGYVAYRNSLKKWDYSVGLRAENVFMKGNVTAAENTNFDKTFFNIFPTARLSYNINQDQFVKISFARRISRPNFGDLNPFVDISNPLSYRTGNPNINPEFMYNFELGYNRIWDNFTLSPTLFYRLRTNVVQRINTLNAETGISFSMPENIGRSNSYGAELTGSARFYKWWDMNLSYSFFQNDVIADQVGRGVNSSVSSWSLRGNNNFTFWKGMRLSLNVFYNSATAIAQGATLPVFGMGMGLQKPLGESKKASIGLNVRDMFYTMRFGSETQGTNFSQKTFIQRDTRVVMANFRYRF